VPQPHGLRRGLSYVAPLELSYAANFGYKTLARELTKPGYRERTSEKGQKTVATDKEPMRLVDRLCAGQYPRHRCGKSRGFYDL
jgi:hypothetical protein